MPKSATDVMQEIMVAATLDAVAALKAASKGLPNSLLRDLNAINANVTVADLPPELQAAITASVRGAFARLLKEGYTVTSSAPAPVRVAPPVPAERPQRPPPPRREPDNRRPVGPRPPPKPKPKRT